MKARNEKNHKILKLWLSYIDVEETMTITRRIKIQSKIQGTADKEDKMIPDRIWMTSCLFEGTSKEDRSLAWGERTSVLHAERSTRLRTK